MSSSREPLRLVRGAAAATVATAVALTGHVLGGGVVPSFLGVLLPWWLSVAVCTVLAGSRFSLPRMALAVTGSQALFHGLFMAGTPGDPSAHLVAPPGDHLGHGVHHGHLAPGGDAAAPHAIGPVVDTPAHTAHGVGDLAQHALHGDHSGTAMILAHLLAAALTTVLLHRGESVLHRCFTLAAQLGRFWLLPAANPAVPVLPDRPCCRVPEALHLLHAQRAQLEPQLRRGPPLVLAA
ncbi:hypothetical protein [Brachybacterium epidermidis]|uniref:hypothetical protein n=1 Tax=Brachybacterium epidermidis TaxID=2781983 RepID=UPI00398F80AF